jgi:hypothetical protein
MAKYFERKISTWDELRDMLDYFANGRLGV